MFAPAAGSRAVPAPWRPGATALSLPATHSTAICPQRVTQPRDSAVTSPLASSSVSLTGRRKPRRQSHSDGQLEQLREQLEKAHAPQSVMRMNHMELNLNVLIPGGPPANSLAEKVQEAMVAPRGPELPV